MHVELILIGLLIIFCGNSLSRQECIILTGAENWRKHSCKALLDDGYKHSGIYMIYPFSGYKGVKVYCDQDTDGGGWMLIQRRIDGLIDFYRNWESYQVGFGNIGDEHWLGLDYIHEITSTGNFELRIDMEDFQGKKRYAKYRNFKVGDASTNYRLEISGFDGDAGDSMAYHNNMTFSTFDRDNDVGENNCAGYFHAGWWYRECYTSNLNGQFGSTAGAEKINWITWRGVFYSLKTVQMKIRPGNHL